ncbi:hypothetical protein KEM56_003758 [Ascosphaera pollenicola]|nr:hypothetical protein KEM56_003758 [Ascosphaera pollenicola]
MPYSLLLTAELQGITNLHPKDSEEAPYYYTFRVQCTSCREEHPNAVSFNRYKTHSASITDAAKTFDITMGKTQSIIELDCRGLEPIEFIADGEWHATGIKSGTSFSNIELEEGEWFDYDNKAGQEVSITDVQWEIRRG